MSNELPISRRGNIPPFIVMDVLQAANQRQREKGDVIHLELGQPATPAPDLVKEAAAKALKDQSLGYTDAKGILPLRERISRHYFDKYGLEVSPERIVVTTGSSAGFILAFTACFNEYELVALPTPGYPCYRHILKSLSIFPITLSPNAVTRLPATFASDAVIDWMPDAQNLVNACHSAYDLLGQRIQGLVMASPANPTGAVLKPDTLEGLINVCKEQKIRFISDEIYHGLNYTGKDHSALEFDDEVIVINSFSKYYSMTGWRIGWMVLPENLVRPVERLMQNLFISAPSLSQYAALAAFDAVPQLEEWKAGYARNRAFLMEALPTIGLPVVIPPDGAFYIYMNIKHIANDSRVLCQMILKETGVAITPGTDFDPEQGHEFIRLSYAGSYADIQEAIARLEKNDYSTGFRDFK